MKYRILTNSHNFFKIQKKVAWFLPWENITKWDDSKHYPYPKIDKLFGSYADAEKYIEYLKFTEGEREKQEKWIVCNHPS